MGNKQVSIVVDLRTGKDIIHVPNLISILSAAGYKPEVALKAYGGETLKLAQKAASEGCGMVISYGGDGCRRKEPDRGYPRWHFQRMGRSLGSSRGPGQSDAGSRRERGTQD